jgi:nucleoside-diphosphate-sugar epimerase
MKILVTGGAGFIGRHLVNFFLKNNREVWVIDNLVTGSESNIKEFLPNKNFHFIKADLVDFDYPNLPSFELVYDLASPASPIDFEKLAFEIIKVNSVGLWRLMDFFVKSKSRRFVFASTSEVYGDPEVDPQPETYFGNVHTTGRRAAYDEGKRFAEAIISNYIRKYDVDARIARIFNTYGPYMKKRDGRFISNFVAQAITGQPMTIYGDGSQTRSSCYVFDMVNGLNLLGSKENLKGEIINIGNPDERQVADVAKLIKKLTNSSSPIVFKPIGEDDPQRRCPDITRAKKLLGWTPKVELEEGLKLTIEYFRSL